MAFPFSWHASTARSKAADLRRTAHELEARRRGVVWQGAAALAFQEAAIAQCSLLYRAAEELEAAATMFDAIRPVSPAHLVHEGIGLMKDIVMH